MTAKRVRTDDKDIDAAAVANNETKADGEKADNATNEVPEGDEVAMEEANQEDAMQDIILLEN